MPQEYNDRQLLFGLLALQNGLIDQVQLVAAFQAWTRDKGRALADHLVAGKALDEQQRGLLDELVSQHVRKHGGRTERCLEAIAAPPTVADRLRAVADADVEASLGFLLARGLADETEGCQLNIPSLRTVPDHEATKQLVNGKQDEPERFRILRPHAKGGLGQVSVAHDLELHRDVALKEILPERAGDAESQARFVQEAEVTGRLEHPGVVPVYSLGYHPGRGPFYAMRLVKGQSLKEAIVKFHGEAAMATARWNLELRDLLNRFVAVCNVIAYAHSRGVIHRDLKPSNVLLGPYGETLVVDWGLAKVIGLRETPDSSEGSLQVDASGSTETMAGAAVGTPSYMSPEQAEGLVDTIGRASDVYGLGALLYSILTGRPPFAPGEIGSILSDVRRGKFPPPRSVNPRVPHELQSVCLKAMALEPGQRYPSAHDLAADIERWLADEPVSVYQEPLSTRATRWGRRNRTIAAAIGALLVTAVAALAIISALVGREQTKTDQQRRRAESNYKDAAQKSRELAEKAGALERQLYANRINLAQREYFEEVAVAEQLLDQCDPAMRGWEWLYLKRLCHLDLHTLSDHQQGVLCVAYSPDGRLLVTGEGKKFQSPDPKNQAELIFWDARTAREIRRVSEFKGSVNSVAFSSDGSRVLVGSGFYERPPRGEGRISILDVATGKVVFDETVRYLNPLAVAYSPDNSLVAAGCGIVSSDLVRGRLMLWEASNGEVAFDQEVSVGGITSLAFSPDGKWLALGCKDVTEIWEVRPMRKAWELRGHESWVYGVAFSPDSKTLATAGWDKTIRLWDANSGSPLMMIDKHGSFVFDVAFSPDGQTLASASADHTVRVWDRSSGRELRVLRGHLQEVNSVAFAPDGKQVVSVSDDGTLKIWDAGSDGQVVLEGHKRWVNAIGFSSDGRRIATGDGAGIVAIWDPFTGKRLLRMEGRNGWVNGVAFSPDGKWLASTGEYGQLHLWDSETGVLHRTIKDLDHFARAVAYSPDGRLLAASTGAHDLLPDTPGSVYLWNAETGNEVHRFRGHSGRILGLAFFPDGQRIASFASAPPGKQGPSEILVWSPSTGEILRRIKGPSVGFRSLVLSHDGLRMAAGAEDGTVRIWDTSTWELIKNLDAAKKPVISLAFSPDGTRLAIGNYERIIRLWDPAAGVPVLSLSGHNAGITALTFSPDGRRLASASIDYTPRIWNASPLHSSTETPPPSNRSLPTTSP